MEEENFLGDHGNKSLTLASGQTENHTSSKMPFVVLCTRANPSTDNHDCSGSEKNDTSTDSDGNWHADEVSDTPGEEVYVSGCVQ